MEPIKSIIKSSYTGSPATAKAVAEEIVKRYGADEAKLYDPWTNCLTYRGWLRHGYRVKKGERGIRSVTFVEKKDGNGETVETYPKNVFLFYRLQVEPLIN